MSIFDELRDVSCIDAARCLGIKLYHERGDTAWAYCPIHGETGHPSLKFYGNGKGWCCFGCHRGGDAVNLYEYVQGVSAIEAARMLADDMGIPVEDEARDPNEIRVTYSDMQAAINRMRRTMQLRASEAYLALDDQIERMIRREGAEACWESDEFRELLKKRGDVEQRMDHLQDCPDEDIVAYMREEQNGKEGTFGGVRTQQGSEGLRGGQPDSEG